MSIREYRPRSNGFRQREAAEKRAQRKAAREAMAQEKLRQREAAQVRKVEEKEARQRKTEGKREAARLRKAKEKLEKERLACERLKEKEAERVRRIEEQKQRRKEKAQADAAHRMQRAAEGFTRRGPHTRWFEGLRAAIPTEELRYDLDTVLVADAAMLNKILALEERKRQNRIKLKERPGIQAPRFVRQVRATLKKEILRFDELIERVYVPEAIKRGHFDRVLIEALNFGAEGENVIDFFEWRERNNGDGDAGECEREAEHKTAPITLEAVPD